VTSNRRIQMGGNIIAAIWIFGGALFFFCRFTLAFYEANRPAVHGALDHLRQLID
jgi:hypothetical protein